MHVLLLPGPTQDVDEVRDSLRASRPDTHVDVCGAEDAVHWLAGNAPCDMVVVDGAHLGEGATALLPALRAQRPGLPIAVLVAAGDAPGEARALLAGADASVSSDGHGLDRLGSLLMQSRRRDVHAQRRSWRLWFAGRDTELRRQLADQLGDRVLLMSLSADGRLVPKIEEPSAATALILDAREKPGDMLLGLRRVREAHPSLSTIVVAEEQHHVAFLGLGVEDCLPPGADVERVLLAVDRLVSARQVAGEVVALRARENRLRALVEYLPDPVVLVSAARTVLAVNLAGLELLGAEEAQQVIGRELSGWLTPEAGSSLDAFVDAVSSGKAADQRAATRHATAPRAVTLRGVPFQREPGKPASVLVVVHETVATAASEIGSAQPDGARESEAERELEAARAQVGALSRDLAVANEAVLAATRRNAELEADAAARADLDRRHVELVASLEHDLHVERARAGEHAQADDLTRASTEALEHLLADEHARADALADIVRQTRDALDRTSARLAALEAEASNRDALAAQAAAESQRLREQVAALEQQLGAVTQERDAVTQERHALAAAQIEAQQQQAIADAEAQRQRDTLAALERTLGETRDALAAAQADSRDQLQTAADDSQRLREQVTALEHQLGAMTQERETLAAQLRDAHDALEAAQQRLTTLETGHADIAALEHQLFALTQDRDALATALAEARAQEQAADDAARAQREHVAALETQLEAAARERQTLTDALHEANESLGGARVTLASLEAGQADAAAAALAQQEAAAREVQDLRARHAALEQQMAQAARDRDEYEAALARLRVDREGLVDALAAAQHDAGVHGAAHAEATQRADVLATRLGQMEREHAERLAALALERDELRRDVGQLQLLRAELPSLREAQRRVVALEGQLSETQMVRAQALALESEVSELRDAREQARRLEAELARTRAELEAIPRPPATLEASVDEETRWLLYEVASIGHLTTTPDARILGANDMAAQLLGHFSRDALQASGRLPAPLLQAAGTFAQRPTRFEVCLQHGDDGPLHWIVGLATPHAGVPATVTWLLIDVSEQRLQARRSRFLRRMEAMTHVLSAATAESSALLERARPLLDAASGDLARRDDLDIDGTRTALVRTHALLTQLSSFARKRARRAGVRDVRALLEETAPVLVHVAGEDIACTIQTDDEPLHATLEPAEFEQFLTALVMAGRDALPLGGRLTLGATAVNTDTRDEGTFFTRPSIELTLHAEGYGAQVPENVGALQESAQRLGGTLGSEFDGRGELRLVVRLARVFVMQ
jgi:PAS domain-containing protein/cell division septum initiation protein DivIVA